MQPIAFLSQSHTHQHVEGLHCLHLGGLLMFAVIRHALTAHTVLIYVVYANAMTWPAADVATLRATAVARMACSL